MGGRVKEEFKKARKKPERTKKIYVQGGHRSSKSESQTEILRDKKVDRDTKRTERCKMTSIKNTG